MTGRRMVGKAGESQEAKGWPVGIVDSECPGRASLTRMGDGRHLLLVDTGDPVEDEAAADRMAAKLESAFAREAGLEG